MMLPTLNTTAKIQKKYTRVTQSGKSVTSLQLSVGEKNPKGEYDNFYFDATFWEKSADFINNNFSEGDFIAIKGDLITTHYAKEDGTKVYKAELRFPKASFVPKSKDNQAPQQNREMLDRNPDGTPYYGVSGEQAQNTYQAPSNQPAPSSVPEIDINEDEIPF